jgi:hypothetical protein
LCGEVVDMELCFFFVLSDDEKGQFRRQCRERMQTFMSTRASSLFRLGAVRRLPMPDGSWELDNSSVLGTLEALEALES